MSETHSLQTSIVETNEEVAALRESKTQRCFSGNHQKIELCSRFCLTPTTSLKASLTSFSENRCSVGCPSKDARKLFCGPRAVRPKNAIVCRRRSAFALGPRYETEEEEAAQLEIF
uniref:Uncharacterized protein n=1 Tax=Odontella aurita TaxID=265563 RepID=A0A7S4IB06_9STRA|mmetsp:Transcript_22371/g.66307  ORF Transcript_22371/g.66307 Transcript_22371/m.66307 type:complete len:116 (+) Transcript_22371:700-1047(+)